MNVGVRTWLLAALLAMTLTVLAGGGALLLWGRVPPFVLPVALVVAALAVRPRDLPAPTLPLLGLLVATTAPLVFGALATDDRSWDGFTTWTLQARFLLEGDLGQPFVRDAAVLNCARGYPLLQPLLLSQCMHLLGPGGGRVVLPLLYLLALLALATPLRQVGVAMRWRGVALAALALLPIVLGPGHGAADSGFAEVLVLALLTAGGGALLLDQPQLAALVAFLLPHAKHEGTPQALLLVLVAAALGRWRAARGACLGAALGLGLWLPLQARLLPAEGPGMAGPWLALLGAALPCCALLLGRALAGRRQGGTVAAILGVAAVAWLVTCLWPSASPLRLVFGAHGGVVTTPAAVGDIVLGIGQQLVWVRKFGFTFPLLLLCVWLGWRRGGLAPVRPLLWLLLLAAGGVLLLLLTRPPATLALFLKEGLPRYTLQLTGIAWLVIARLLHDLLPERADSPAA